MSDKDEKLSVVAAKSIADFGNNLLRTIAPDRWAEGKAKEGLAELVAAGELAPHQLAEHVGKVHDGFRKENRARMLGIAAQEARLFHPR